MDERMKDIITLCSKISKFLQLFFTFLVNPSFRIWCHIKFMNFVSQLFFLFFKNYVFIE